MRTDLCVGMAGAGGDGVPVPVNPLSYVLGYGARFVAQGTGRISRGCESAVRDRQQQLAPDAVPRTRILEAFVPRA